MSEAADESIVARWRRRAVTVPVLLLLWGLGTAALTLLPLVALGDVVARRRFGRSRTLIFFAAFLWCELLGLAAATAIWLLVWRSPARYLAANAWLQARWGHTLFAAARWLYAVRVRVEGEVPRPGSAPLLVFVRHVSTGDTVLPIELLAFPLGWRVRYVLKRELLLDPCLDIVGHRLPNQFVRRQSDKTDEQVARVVSLLDGMGSGDALVIYPEGTRYSAKKREQALARLRDKGPSPALTLAEELGHTLSPLRAGPLALLERNRGADLLVLAHRGLEGFASLASLTSGALVGGELRVKLLYTCFADLPRDAAGQRRRLAELWREVDRFAAG